uniref:ANK_REP_REGION domain-containing protein n=2 Tax=Caenorhabditis japonica TaxID=281687 RepID=A0A8R1EEX7_CAEJA
MEIDTVGAPAYQLALDVNEVDGECRTAMYLAVAEGHLEVIQTMTESGIPAIFHVNFDKNNIRNVGSFCFSIYCCNFYRGVMMEEPVNSADNIGETAPKVFDYAKIVAEHLNVPFDYKNTFGRQNQCQLRKKTPSELFEQAQNGDNSDDSDDDDIINLHESVGEISLKTLTSVPMVRAFNLAEKRLEAKNTTKK